MIFFSLALEGFGMKSLYRSSRRSLPSVIQCCVIREHFGTVRVQRVACDNGFQLPDVSANLTSHDAHAYRSAVGGLLYLARDRPDFAFPVKELSAKMAQPTVTALQRLRKVMGYVKGTPEFAVTTEEPTAENGKWKTTNEAFWILESVSDSDWSSNREHRRNTSSGIHLVTGFFAFGSSKTQKTVSLPSCEAELHAMVSSLADGIYIKRCLAFIQVQKFAMCFLQIRQMPGSFVQNKVLGSYAMCQGRSYGYDSMCLWGTQQFLSFQQHGTSLTWGQKPFKRAESVFCSLSWAWQTTMALLQVVKLSTMRKWNDTDLEIRNVSTTAHTKDDTHKSTG